MTASPAPAPLHRPEGMDRLPEVIALVHAAGVHCAGDAIEYMQAHIAALEQRVETIGRAVEIARKRGALALEIDVAMENALPKEPR